MAQVAFQGERGAYGDEAVVRHFGPDAEPVPCRSFADVFRLVAGGQVEFGMVPIENSIAGSINDNYDLLRQYDLYVQGERVVQVNHCLLALPGTQLKDVRRIISHPRALEQCESFFREHGIEAVAEYDTAGSAKLIREKELHGLAAIASRRAAEIYGLDVVAEGIQDVKDNYTRFFQLGRTPAAWQAGPTRTSLVMSTAHTPGALHKCLGALAARSINLLKLESRPVRNRPWEYVFYLDFEGHRDDSSIAEALAELAAHTSFLKVLGSYPRDLGGSTSSASGGGL